MDDIAVPIAPFHVYDPVPDVGDDSEGDELPVDIVDVGLLKLDKKLAERMHTEDGNAACPVCLEDFEEGDLVAITGCGHTFCTKCVGRFTNGRCPICRRMLPTMSQMSGAE